MELFNKEVAKGLSVRIALEDGKLKVALEEELVAAEKQLLDKVKVLIPGDIDDKIIDAIEAAFASAAGAPPSA